MYAYSSNSWTQLGSDIDGEENSDHSGYSVSMNDAGDRVAIGAIYNDGGGSNSGHARVYTYDATAPAAVAGLTATSYNGGASLSWTANSESDIHQYYIYSSTDNSTYTKHSTEPTTNSATITDLTKGTRYYYKVSAVDNAHNEGSKSSATGLVYASRAVYVTTAGTGNGLSSGTPTKYLSTAVTNSGTGDTIHVAAGTYTFTSASEGNISFNGTKNLVIKGAAASTTIIDANLKHRHFYFSASSSNSLLDTTFKIMNLTLKNGRPQSNDHGGSVYMDGYHVSNYGYKGHSPLFQNVVFQSNQTRFTTNDYHKYGGAVYAYRSTPYFRNVTFKYNTAPRQGGAIYVHNADTNKTVTFERTTFTSNYTDLGDSETNQYGGAVYLSHVGKVVFNNSVFDSNTVNLNCNCDHYGGAVYANELYDSLVVRNTKFRYNKVYKPSGNEGGGARAGAMYVRTRGHFLVTNSIFIGNEAVSSTYTNDNGSTSNHNSYGGALYIDLNNFSNAGGYTYPYKSIFINNTFVDNKSEGAGNSTGHGGAIRYEWEEKTVLINNIFWGNTANNTTDTTGRWEIQNLFNNSNVVALVGHNNFQYSAATANSYGDNNISRDPEFLLGSGADKYKLTDASFLIGAGAKTYDSYTAPGKDCLLYTSDAADE